MRRKFNLWSILLVGILFFYNGITAEGKTLVKIYLDGIILNTENLAENRSGSVFVPLTAFTKKIPNANVSFDNKKKVTTVLYNGKKILIDSSKGTVTNHAGIAAKQKVFLQSGRTMVPIRFLAENLDFDVFWDGQVHVASKIHMQSNTKIPILMYHAVDPQNRKNDGMWVTPTNFQNQMNAIKYAGYTTIDPFQLQNFYQTGAALPAKPILITFDDGYKNVEYAYPILKKYNQKATIFGIVSRIEHEGTISYPHENAKLTWEDYQSMGDVFTLQNHTWDSHKQVKDRAGKTVGLIGAQLINENGMTYKARVVEDLTKAQEKIKEMMGYESVMLAYPYGNYTKTTLQAAKEAGIPLGASIEPGINNRNTTKLELYRITVNGKDDPAKLLHKIKNGSNK